MVVETEEEDGPCKHISETFNAQNSRFHTNGASMFTDHRTFEYTESPHFTSPDDLVSKFVDKRISFPEEVDSPSPEEERSPQMTLHSTAQKSLPTVD